MLQKVVVVGSKYGLHARPSAKICEIARKYGGTSIRVRDPSTGSEADARSILSLLAMSADTGTKLEVTADGDNESAALEEITGIIENFSVDS
jgi:phosphocarrier protein HPr